MERNAKLKPNSLAFIALANEYCHAMESAIDMEREQLVAHMLKLLPRLYIAASDLGESLAYSEYDIEPYLDEEAYDQVRDFLSQLMAEEDVYLEVFVEDMKYSDTPISATVSENLADLYQEFFNFIANVKDATTAVQQELLGIEKSNFGNYWGQTLCNVLRALNTIYYNPMSADERGY